MQFKYSRLSVLPAKIFTFSQKLPQLRIPRVSEFLRKVLLVFFLFLSFPFPFSKVVEPLTLLSLSFSLYGFSHLSFSHFQVSLKLLCSCDNNDIETTYLYLVNFSKYSNKSFGLLSSMTNVDIFILQTDNSNFIYNLRFGRTSLAMRKIPLF